MKKRYDFKNHIKGQCIKKYKKVHIEITNICNLKCTFCPPKILPSTTMDISLFERINEQLKVYTKEVAYHIVGDPLIVTRLRDYLNISHKHGLKVNLTTTANNLNASMYESLMHPALKQVNFSLNSYQANSHKKTLEQYLIPIFDYVAYAMKMEQSHFINLRIWNLDESQSAKTFNQAVFDFANERLSSDIDLNEVYSTPPKNIRVAPKVFFNFDEYFKWPSLKDEVVSKKGFCYGLDSHFGILASGKVVPCCLDQDGIIDLGDVTQNDLSHILTAPRTLAMKKGFKQNVLSEELCQKCTYRTRFK